MKNKFLLSLLLLGCIGLTSCNNQGPIGPAGPQGPSGEPGLPGQNGQDGVGIVSINKTNTEGNLDTYTITYSNGTTSIFVVVNGKDGEKGIQGVPGKDGNSPTVEIGSNGNWFVDGVDTDIKAQGSKGDKGDKGDQGEQGVPGKDGKPGDKGETGPQGPQGDKGDQGIPGKDGADGQDGAPGKDGADGQDGKSAYEIYIASHPEYKGDEKQWLDDLVNGRLGNQQVHTITFDTNGALTIPDVKVKHGEKITKPADPYIEGYTFINWTYQGEPWSFIGYVVTEDMTLTANFRRSYLEDTFGENINYSEKHIIDNREYPRLLEYYDAKMLNGLDIGKVFVCKGENQFGEIKMSVAINLNYEVYKIYLMRNGQSSAEQLQKGYVDKVNEGTRQVDDVYCGATFGAELIHTMSNEAKNYYQYVINKETVADRYVSNIFGDRALYIEKTPIDDPSNINLVNYWNATDSQNNYIGRVYYATIDRPNNTFHLLVGVTLDGNLHKVSLLNEKLTSYDEITHAYIEGLNDGTVYIEDKIANGATSSCNAVQALVKQALAHYSANKIQVL